MALRRFDFTLLDINQAAVDEINRCVVPFFEEGAEALLRKHVGKNLFDATDCDLSKADVAVFATGTPIDEHLNPKVNDIVKVFSHYLPQMNESQLVILRITIFPAVSG